MLHVVAALLMVAPAAPAQDQPPLDDAALKQLIAKLGGSVRQFKSREGEVRWSFDIDLSGTKTTDRDLQTLAKSNQVLFLDLADTAVTDAGMAHLAKLNGLAALNVAGTTVSDVGLKHLLARAEELNTLSLAFTAVTDAGLAHVGKMTRLESIDLTGTKVTDAGLENLWKLEALDTLGVAKTGVTNKALQIFIDRRPTLRLSRKSLGDRAEYQVREEFRDGRLYLKELHVRGIIYGSQYAKLVEEKGASPDGIDRSRMPTTYYTYGGPAGQVLSKFNWFGAANDGLKNPSDARLPVSVAGLLTPSLTPHPHGLVALHSEPAIGVIGITAGTVAAYGRPFQHIHFYHNTPEIAAFSLPERGDKPVFGYIQDAKQRGAIVKVVAGDERRELRKGPKGFYSALIVEMTQKHIRDINTKLFTQEALEQFMEHLTEQGVVCFHITHRYHNLLPPLADAARALNFACFHGTHDEVTGDASQFSSEWVMISRKAAYLDYLKDTKLNKWVVPESSGSHNWHDGDKHDLGRLKVKMAP